MIIFRYICKEIFGALFATMLVLLLLFGSNQLIHQLDDAASGKITVHAAFLLMSVQLPTLMCYLLSLALFLGVLLTFGRLQADRETVVLSSCGVSKARLLGMVMIFASVVMLLDAWLMLKVEPDMFRYRVQIMYKSKASVTLDKILPGRFQPIGGDQRVLYAGDVDKSLSRYRDVFVAIRSDAKRSANQAPQWNLTLAKQVREDFLPGQGKFFVFESGNQYIGTPGTTDYKKANFQAYWRLFNLSMINTKGYYSLMPTGELIRNYRKDLGALVELQWRIVVVLSSLAFAFLAVPLSETFPGLGRFFPLLPAAAIYIIYANLMFVSKAWLQRGALSPRLGLWWILALLVIIGAALHLRQMGWHRIRFFLRGKK